MGRRFVSVDYRKVYLDGDWHHLVVFDPNDSTIELSDLKPKCRYADPLTWTGPVFTQKFDWLPDLLKRHGTVKHWEIIDSSETEDLHEGECGLLVPKLFWGLWFFLPDRTKASWFYLEEE